MTPKTGQMLRALLVVAALVGFAAIFVVGIAQVFTAKSHKPPMPKDSLVYVATALAALVGGIVAVGFGVAPTGGDEGNLRRNLTSLGSLTTAGQGPSELISGAYAVIYVILGIGAIVAWVAKPDETSGLVKNLATTFFGLALPIVSAYFKN